MNASNTPRRYVFNVWKRNKTNVIYSLEFGQTQTELIREFVKIERYQGFSKVRNVDYYFRVKNATTWSKSKALTGLFNSKVSNCYFGDVREGKRRTLLLFRVYPLSGKLEVFEFPKGYYPDPMRIDYLIQQIGR